MRTTTPTAALLGLVLLAASAQANPAFVGDFRLEGRYSNQRRTRVDLTVTDDGQTLRATRTGRYTSAALASRPAWTWISSEVAFHENGVMRVTYRLSGGTSVNSLIEALDPATMTTADASAAFGKANVIEALYVLSPGGNVLREYTVNTTKVGAESNWSWSSTRGPRVSLPDDVPAITLTSNHPNARLQRQGDVYLLTSDGTGSFSALGNQHAVATLTFDGKSIQLQAGHNGLFSAHELPALVPDGYFAKAVTYHDVSGQARATFELRRDRPGTLTTQQALAIARRGLVTFIRAERMHDTDWKGYFSSTWSGLLAEGVMDGIDRFGLQTGDEPATIIREADRYVIYGPGPFELHTEVIVSKADGHLILTYVEID